MTKKEALIVATLSIGINLFIAIAMILIFWWMA